MSSVAPARPHPRARLLVVLAAVALAGLALFAGAPAGAHGGDGQMEVTSLERDGDDVTITVHLSYVADGHGVPDATVTVVVDDGTPAPMTAGATEGDYAATVVAAPGATLRVTSVEPPVTVDATAPEAATTTTTETTTTAGSDTTDAPATTDATTTTAPADGSTTSTPATDAEDDDGGNGLVIGGLIALVVVAAAAVAVVVLRKPTPDADS